MARGPLMPSPLLPLRPSLRLRLMPMPTTAMVDTALAMEATAMAAMVDTDMARGPQMPMPTTAMADTDTAMAVTALAMAMDTDMERGQLTLMLMRIRTRLWRLRPWLRPWIRIWKE